MKRLLFLLLWFVFVSRAFCQGIPVVPSHMEFAGIKLILKESARREIQADVNKLHGSRSYFDKMVNVVDLYFPSIERILKEENVPGDFKYLAIQESAMVPDAVSSSKAVGFWQFKAETARELGLRIDRYIDERMNIHAATHAAARYMKTSNFYFKNWLYALMSYQTGRGGAKKLVKDKYRGANKMEINKHTYWYVKKFLAYKIAFEHETGKNKILNFFLQEYTNGANKTLAEIGGEYHVDPQLMSKYNKWLKRGKIPEDRTYVVLIPIKSTNQYAKNHLLKGEIAANGVKEGKRKTWKSKYGIAAKHFEIDEMEVYPIIKRKGKTSFYQINGIFGSVAQDGDTPSTLALLGAITEEKFLKFNDLTPTEKIMPGQVYYFKNKRKKAAVHFHIVQPGETLWSISQKYGLKLKKLKVKNRLKSGVQIKPGLVLWLRFIRPADVPVEYREVKKPSTPVAATRGQQNENPYLFERTTPKNNTSSKEMGKKEISESNYIDEKSYVDLSKERSEKSSPPSGKAAGEIYGNVRVIDHRVKKGETVFGISREYGVTVESIKKWNNLNDNTLDIGQILEIRKTDSSGESRTNTDKNNNFLLHKVQQNETLYSIARKYGVTIKQMMRWNDKEDFSVKINEILKIYKKE